MKRLAAAGARSVPSTLGAHTTCLQAAVAAPTRWAARATQALSLANATDLGALPGTKVRLGLQMRNADALKAAVASGQIVPRSAFISTYAPASDQVAHVVSYLQSQGLTDVHAEANNLLADADSSAAAVQTQNGVDVYANVTSAFVPQNLAGVVIAVLGSNDAQAAKAAMNASIGT